MIKVGSSEEASTLTRDDFKRQVNEFFELKLDKRYVYDIYFSMHFSRFGIDVKKRKWKFYLYLMKCVIDYRECSGNDDNDFGSLLTPYRSEKKLLEIITFLEDKKKYGDGKTKTTNKSWLASQLMDVADRETDDLWGSGMHEWLLRSLIVDVLKRSAGMCPNVQSHIEEYCVIPAYDWLMLQAEVRTKTKYIFYENDEKTLESGHVGAMKKSIQARGFVTKGGKEFDNALIAAFYKSTTIRGFLARIEKVIKKMMVSGNKEINPSDTTNYTVDGTATSDGEKITEFCRQKVYPEGYASTRLLIWSHSGITNHFDVYPDEHSASSSESSESEDISSLVEVANQFHI